MKNDRALKIIASISFLLLTSALLVIRNSPATGYEASIYTSTPPLVWVFLIVSIGIGVYLIVHQAFTKESERSSWWLIGFVIIILANLILTSLGSLRGYFFARGDLLTHVGYEMDIISTGYLSQENFYPILHILATQIALISNISPIILMNYLGNFFSIMCMVYIYILAKTIWRNRGQVLVVTASSAVLLLSINNIYARPNNSALLMLPLIFFLYFKVSQQKLSPTFRIMFLLLVILFAYFHPIIAFVLMATYIVLELSKVGFDLIATAKKPNLSRKPFLQLMQQVSVIPTLIALVTLLTWFMSYALFEATVHSTIDWFSGEAIHNPTSQALTSMAKIGRHGFGVVGMLFRMLGHNFIFFLFSVVAIVMILRRVLSSPEDSWRNPFMLVVWLIPMGLLNIAVYFAPDLFSWDRIFQMIALLSTIFVGFVLYEIFNRPRFFILKVIPVTIIITTLAAVGVSNLYRSHYIGQPTLQVTQMEMHGWRWFFDHKDSEVKTTTLLTPSKRFADAILGTDRARGRKDVPREYTYEGGVPDHFNYTHYSTLGESYETNRYMVVSQWDRSLYTEVWTLVGRFTNDDFARLEDDPTVHKLYSNGDVDVWRIIPMKEG